MTRKFRKNKLPKYNLGAIMGAVTGAGSLMGGIANAFTDDPNKKERNDAFFKYAGFGIPGLIAGAFGAKKVREQQAERDKLQKQQEFQQRRSNFMAGLEPTTNYNPVFPLGGTVPYGPGYNQPNAELETDEVYRLPNGHIQDVPDNTPPHEQGGVEMQLPPGTQILGEGDHYGEEFKQLGQRLERLYKKHQKILKNRPTPLAKSTSEKMLGKVQKQYTKLIDEQEAKRNEGDLGKKNYRYGGKVKKYYTGTDGTGELEPWMLDQSSFNVSNSPLTPRSMEQALGVTQPTASTESTSLGYTGNAFPAGRGNGNIFGNVDPSRVGRIAETAGIYAPVLYNAFRGIFNKPDIINEGDYQNPYETQVRSLMRGRRFNVDPLLDRNRTAQRTFSRNVRNTGATPGATLGNLQAGAAARMRADSAALAQKQNMDNQYLAQEASTLGSLGQARANRSFQIRDINDRNRAAQRNFLPTALGQLQQGLQVNRQMRNQASTDRIGLATLPDLVPSYDFNYDYFQELRNNGKAPIKGSLYNYRY